jgi:hypothetical protein
VAADLEGAVKVGKSCEDRRFSLATTTMTTLFGGTGDDADITAGNGEPTGAHDDD